MAAREATDRLMVDVDVPAEQLPAKVEGLSAEILVGPQGATVLNAVGRVEPVTDARSDWFTRRLSTQAGDTMGD